MKKKKSLNYHLLLDNSVIQLLHFEVLKIVLDEWREKIKNKKSLMKFKWIERCRDKSWNCYSIPNYVDYLKNWRNTTTSTNIIISLSLSLIQIRSRKKNYCICVRVSCYAHSKSSINYHISESKNGDFFIFLFLFTTFVVETSTAASKI